MREEINSEALGHANGSLYCDLMDLLKQRVDAVIRNQSHLETGDLTKKSFLHNAFIGEFCLLQLRYSCELLALGCIAMHTDVPQNKQLEDEWHAGKIMRKFGKLKPTFFPIAIATQIMGEIGGLPITGEGLMSGALTKAEFLKMYEHFGSLLHVGSFKKFSPQRPAYDFPMIDSFTQRLMKLLNIHIYFLDSDKRHVRVMMNDARGNISLRVSVMSGAPSPYVRLRQ